MLIVVTSVEPWILPELQSIFGVTEERSTNDYEEIADFLRREDGFLCFWNDGNEYVSSCRISINEGGYLLHNLATKLSMRRKGYAGKLIASVIEFLKNKNVSTLKVHIRKDNIASLRLHESVGFVKIKDTARLLDGTITSSYVTMEYRIN